MNTGLSIGDPGNKAFYRWRRFSQRVDELDLPLLIRNTLKRRVLTDLEAAAYGAPFPCKEYQPAALVFPRLVPTGSNSPGVYENRLAIERLKTLGLHVLLPWGEEDEITRPAEPFLRSIFHNVAPPLLLKGVGHFIQEDAGEEVARHIVDWMKK